MTAQDGNGRFNREDAAKLAAVLVELRELFEGAQGWRDVHGIAAHLGKKPQTIQNMTGPKVDDPIPFHRIHGAKWFYVPEVDAWGLSHDR